MSASISPALVAALVRRPRLWPTAVRQAVRLAPPGWWRRPPFVPVPDRDYLRFRALTQYADADHALEAADAVAYLEWCRSQGRAGPRRQTRRPREQRIH